MVMKYKPILCLKEVPMKMMPKDVLKNLKWWYVDCQTTEAVMEDEDEQEILRVYDPMHLVNLSQADLQVLNDMKIFYIPAWKDEAKKYQRVVSVCVR